MAGQEDMGASASPTALSSQAIEPQASRPSGLQSTGARRVIRQDIKDEIARLRFERDKYRKLATQRRKDAQERRRQRDWLAAIECDDRAREYRDIAHARQAAMNSLKSAA